MSFQKLFPLPRAILSLAMVVAFGLLPVNKTHAINDEGIALAMEAAFPYVKDGFKVRMDTWSGKMKAGDQKLIKHQLFRGNEYWFWAATSFPKAKATIGIYDAKGNSVALESFSKDGKTGVRVLPKKNGSYFIWIKVESDDFKEVDWGVIYGYR